MEPKWGEVPAGLARELKALLADGPARLALAWLDVTTGEGWTWDDRPVPAASLVKVPLAIAALQAAEAGTLDLRERVAVPPLPEDDEAEFDDLGRAPAGQRFAWQKVIDRMVTESDNAATNALIDRLGPGALGGLVARLGLRHTTLARRMLDAAARQAGRENFTTAADAATVLYALRRGELLGADHTALLLALLGQQRHDEKIPRGLPVGTLVRHKTGELSGWRHDAAIVEDTRPYVLVALAETREPGEADALIARVAAVVHAYHQGISAETAAGQEALARALAEHDDRLAYHDLRVLPGEPPVLEGATTLHLDLPGVASRARRLTGRAGVVVAPLVQLRGGPGHARELVSQLRLGDPVEVLELGDEWHRLRGPDGYVAFGRSNNLLLTDGWAPTHLVTAPSLEVPLPHGRRLVLSAGSRLKAAGAGAFELPDGTRVEADVLDAADGTLGLAPIGTPRSVDALLDFALSFLGLPYLWGGTTCWGLDCSGLVQLSHAACGVFLPRDADQQQAATGLVATIEALRRGDLVFFPGHVGLYLGGGRYVHASAHQAMVTINSFYPADPLYDAKLHAKFSGGGRSPLAARVSL